MDFKELIPYIASLIGALTGLGALISTWRQERANEAISWQEALAKQEMRIAARDLRIEKLEARVRRLENQVRELGAVPVNNVA